MSRRIVCLASALLVFAAQGVCLTPVPRTGGPPPPLGWEENVTPGFDPPIEETLVLNFYLNDAERKAVAERWGAKAVPVLRKLLESPLWADYHRNIQHYLAILAVPGTEEEQLARMDELLAKDELDEMETSEYQRLNEALGAAKSERYRQFLLERIPTLPPAGKDRAGIALLAHWPGDEHLQFLQAHIPKTEQGWGGHNWLEHHLSRWRAQRPMSEILNAEAEKNGKEADAP